ncbi:MAG: hypothetical protein JSR58_04745 [Verrucomicrobia bacterium]|nr:hypothetical protein [Verrucomicrobiota bacterium]
MLKIGRWFKEGNKRGKEISMSKKIESFAPHIAQPVKGPELKKENKVTAMAMSKLNQKFKAKPLKPLPSPKNATKTSKIFFSALKKRQAA